MTGMFDIARKALFAALLAGVAGPAFAADYYEPPVEEVPVYGGWYIRGHIGMSNQFFDELTSSLYLEPSILDYGFTTTAASARPRSSAAASATSSTTICAATSS